MPSAIIVSNTVVVPADALSVSTARSSGPGGQNVNKVASKVDLRVEIDRIVGLRDDARARLLVLCRNRLDAEGRLQVISQLTRDQGRNIVDACEKAKALIAQALVAPKRRRKTKPSRGAVQSRLNDKHSRSIKKQRRSVNHDD